MQAALKIQVHCQPGYILRAQQLLMLKVLLQSYVPNANRFVRCFKSK